jgi:hypothetical protein
MQRKLLKNRDHGVVYVHLSQLEVWVEDADHRVGKHVDNWH